MFVVVEAPNKELLRMKLSAAFLVSKERGIPDEFDTTFFS